MSRPGIETRAKVHMFRTGRMGRANALGLPLLLGLTLGIVAAGPGFAASKSDAAFQPLVAALHVHSSWSTGSLTLDQLAERAEGLGIQAIVLSDNFALRYEYGLPPFRSVIRRTVAFPSLTSHEMSAFLSSVAAAQERHPNVLLVPGIEVTPHYYWTGSLLDRNLTMHNGQRNFLVVGLSSSRDYASLPLTGNPASYHYGWESLGSLVPGLLFIPAGWMWHRRTTPPRRWTVPRVVLAKARGGSAVILAVTGVLLIMNAWPLSRPAFSSYDQGLGYRPYQAVIDMVTNRKGLVIWSLPEARDFNQYSYGPLGTVTVKTDPHPGALTATKKYTGFGGLYQDSRGAHQPGGPWDRTIMEYLEGQRTTPPVLFGEIAFHRPGEAGIRLDQVVNVLRVRNRSVSGILDALRAGRLYVVGQYRPGVHLRLDEFQVASGDGASTAEVGGWLTLPETRELMVSLSVSAADDQAHPITVTVVRSGQVIAQKKGSTPFSHRFLDRLDGQTNAVFYRVAVEGRGEILSNPIFVGTDTGLRRDMGSRILVES